MEIIWGLIDEVDQDTVPDDLDSGIEDNDMEAQALVEGELAGAFVA